VVTQRARYETEAVGKPVSTLVTGGANWPPVRSLIHGRPGVSVQRQAGCDHVVATRMSRQEIWLEGLWLRRLHLPVDQETRS